MKCEHCLSFYFMKYLEVLPFFFSATGFETTAQDVTCDKTTFQASKLSESLVAQSERLASDVGGRLNVLLCERDKHGDRCWRPPPHFSCPPLPPLPPTLPSLPHSLVITLSPPWKATVVLARAWMFRRGLLGHTGGSDACGWPMRLTASSMDL